MTALLSVEGLSRSFGGLTVVDDVTFAVEAGGRVALIGPNGAGKTTVFNLLSGVYAPDRGRIVFDGTDIVAVPSRRRIALGLARSFQNIRLMPHLSAVENVMLGQHARASGIPSLLSPLGRSSRWRREAEARLASLGLSTFPGEVVANLPYGVRKKIEIARALMARPKLLLLDEPAAGLNPAETASLRDFLLQVSGEGTTLLVVEHDMSFVRSLCGHAVVLNFGRKIFDGPTAGVQSDPAVLEAYLGPRRGGTGPGSLDDAA
jgi:branched-chain amino acid transport system ATP-binding protein